MRKIVYKLCNYLLDVLYPKRCAICDRTITNNRGICQWCEARIKLIEEPTCMKCGKKLKDEADRFCYDCKRSHKVYDRGFAVFEYDYIKESLFKFKYSNRPEYSRFYGIWAYERYGETLKRLGVEVLIPVPIHKKREGKRGYNQACELATVLSELTGIPVQKGLVARQINTAPLKKMKATQRQKNLKKAFKLKRNDVKFKKVCIVDDIYTTGATIDTIAGMLKDAGVTEVYFVAVAIGVGI